MNKHTKTWKQVNKKPAKLFSRAIEIIIVVAFVLLIAVLSGIGDSALINQ